ncbi:ABC transporter substrate-binding protein [Pelagibacterium xiamenense]|uniref:ABC transporter substrate-binding protein n=1 Tax=Pelagibacterium xiamenense TaxID=2901140 RepID=UPI001E2AD6EC|nr:ABC transporter substrate-binding protein [Pelagibacterium xiamenense]MCD7058675.1 ABC transporter substrate-binding protein [Pelagibacterium xiamenense]
MKYFKWTAGVALALAALAAPAAAQDFPLTLEHKFGTTIIEQKPERVASIDYGGIGNLLAVGVSPVTVRQWRVMDGFEHTAGPWAEHLLTTEPVVLDGDLDFEAIAATDPDVIVALYSGIEAADYEKLSLIAPVVAVPEGVSDYGLTWEERARLVARALGEEAEAERQIAAIQSSLANIAASHPEWAGMTAVLGGFRDGAPFAYTEYDVRAQFLYQMGFVPTGAMAELSDPDGFWLDLSPEQLDVIDADVVVHYDTDDEVAVSLEEPARVFLRAYETGGEVFLGDLPVAALARVSLLSIPVALEALVPMLEAAADGDPATEVPDARQ